MDGYGIEGMFFHGTLTIALVASAFLVFIYLWRKKRLDLDEEPKYRMMDHDE